MCENIKWEQEHPCLNIWFGKSDIGEYVCFEFCGGFILRFMGKCNVKYTAIGQKENLQSAKQLCESHYLKKTKLKRLVKMIKRCQK